MTIAFADTDVLIYAADESGSVDRKTRIARELLRHRALKISVQVLNEFTVNARNAKKLNFTESQENEWLSRWLLFPVVPLTAETFLSARLLHSRYPISHGDSLIIATARAADCAVVYSEALNLGRSMMEFRL